MKQLEDNLNVTLLELDKYKLLVNESDVITNLLLKLCNKNINNDYYNDKFHFLMLLILEKKFFVCYKWNNSGFSFI